jgi:hypothetical protein
MRRTQCSRQYSAALRTAAAQPVADAILPSVGGVSNGRARCAGVMRWTFPTVGHRTTPRKRNPSARKIFSASRNTFSSPRTAHRARP